MQWDGKCASDTNLQQWNNTGPGERMAPTGVSVTNGLLTIYRGSRVELEVSGQIIDNIGLVVETTL